MCEFSGGGGCLVGFLRMEGGEWRECWRLEGGMDVELWDLLSDWTRSGTRMAVGGRDEVIGYGQEMGVLRIRMGVCGLCVVRFEL
ncbi:hypothetical protein J0A71_04g07570 [Encephalitozoon cuniculi]|nr:hypothetical protein J0A71_04g07570 [Encephalitozoon cuniculi]